MKRPAVLFGCVGVCCLAAIPAHANSVSVCKPDTPMTELSGGCSIGDLFFSGFVYHNSGLQVTPGVFVTPANILVTATPSGVTFSTNYGFKGGFTNASGPEEEGELGYDVSVERGNRLINGLELTGGTGSGLFGGGALSEIACLGADNPTTTKYHNPGMSGYTSIWLPLVCPENPSASMLLHSFNGTGFTPSTAVFSPVRTIGVSIGLFVSAGSGLASLSENPTVSAFTNEILLVPEPATLTPLIPGLLGLAVFSLKKATA
jgi:hypothetical protein